MHSGAGREREGYCTGDIGQQGATSRRFSAEYRWPCAYSKPATLRGRSILGHSKRVLYRAPRCARQFPALGIGICNGDAAAHGRNTRSIGSSQHRKLIVHEGTMVRSEGWRMNLPTKFRPSMAGGFPATRSAGHTSRLGSDEKPKHASSFEVRSLNNRGRRIRALGATTTSPTRRRRVTARSSYDRSVRGRHQSDVDDPIIGIEVIWTYIYTMRSYASPSSSLATAMSKYRTHERHAQFSLKAFAGQRRETRLRRDCAEKRWLHAALFRLGRKTPNPSARDKAPQVVIECCAE